MDWVCDGDGGVRRGCRRAKYWPSTGVVGNSGNGYVDGCAGELGFRQGCYRVRTEK